MAVGGPAAPPTGWAERWIEEIRASLPEAPRNERPATAARLAMVLLACARDEEADNVLMAARREAVRSGDAAELARIEIALAASAVVRDDDATADTRLAQARQALASLPPSLAARAWIVASRRARASGAPAPAPPPDADDALDPDERLELQVELALERAIVARDGGDMRVAHVELGRAHEAVEVSGSRRLMGAFELEAAGFAAATGNLTEARPRFQAAIQIFSEAGLRRDEGRAMIRFAEVLATSGDGEGEESAAVWLGRAQQILATAATWRDRLAIRSGFRNFGRRVFDRVMTDTEAFEKARGSLVNALTNVAHATDGALTDLEVGVDRGEDVKALESRIEGVRTAARDQAASAMQAVRELDESMRDLVELIGAAIFERDRLRLLLNILSEIDVASEESNLSPLAASLAMQLLDADRVVIAVERGGELQMAGEAGHAAPGSEDDWRKMEEGDRRPVTRASDPVRLETRPSEAPRGPRLGIPFRRREVSGLLYADKLRRSGQFREQDQAIAHLYTEYVALAFGRLRAREQELFALHQLAVTLDTIRDGVFSCDATGVIVSLNAAAARMLQIPQNELRGAYLASIPLLKPLASMLSVTPRLDGAVVRLSHGSFVVTRYGFHDIVGTSPSLQTAITMARRAAQLDANVLITGESGTGKEVIAQAIHSSGPRASEPFIGVNCAAVPRDLLEAELFGYEKGAYTGARTEGNPGKFELAAGGTILLDEIGDMPLDMQAKLLRVLQERVVTRLGGRSEVPVHARVIATTHRDLAQLVDEGKFRMDLFYRLRVLALDLPPLRDRQEDIPLLAQSFLLRFAEQQRKRVRELGPRVLDELGRYDWPGNVRELANVIEAEVSLAPPDVDVIERLATRLIGRFRTMATGSTGEWRALNTQSGAHETAILPLAEVEKRAILNAIERCGGSVSKAAEALGVSKVTIYAKLRTWGMHPRDRGEETGEHPAPPQSARWTFSKIPAAGAAEDAPPATPASPATKRPPRG